MKRFVVRDSKVRHCGGSRVVRVIDTERVGESGFPETVHRQEVTEKTVGSATKIAETIADSLNARIAH